MNIGARKAVLFTVVIAILAGGFLAALSSPARAQDVESLFAQAKDLWERGRTNEAANVLKQLLAQDPSQEAVYNLLRKVEYQMFLDLLTAGGDAELVAKRLLELGHLGEQERAKDEEAIKGLVQQAIKGQDYGERQSAVKQLVARHGEYSVPYLYHYLGSSDREERVNAILALSELGGDAVLPLIEVLKSDDYRVQQNAAHVLKKIGDYRAIGGLASLAARAANPAAAEAAGGALASISGGAPPQSPADAYLALAAKYYMKDPAVIRNYLGTYAIWGFTDGKLVDRQVPSFLYHLDLAEEACYDALDEDAAHIPARDMLAAIHYAQWAAVQSLTAEAKASEEGQALIDKLWNVYLLTVSQGPDTQLGAVTLGLMWGDEGISIGALGALPKVWDDRAIDGSSPLVQALDGPKTVRFAAAVACLELDPGAAFPGSEKVMQLAAQAADCGSARQVLLVEPDPVLRGKALKVLDDAGMFATAEPSAVEGFRRAKEIGTFDVILIRADLKDQLALTIVKNLKEDFRTASTPILITGTQSELDQAKELFATGVQDFLLIDPLDANRVKEAASGSIRDDQARALAVSLAACNALAGIDTAKTAFADFVATEGALDGVVKSGKPDEIRLAALAALRNLGSAASLETLVAAFRESANAAPVRVGAALALGGILSGQPAPAAVFSALLEGVGDEAREVRKAAAEGLGEMKLTPEQQNEVLTKYRVM
jgi:HEAT repeat protein